MAEEKHYLELSEEGGGSHKFYEVIVDGCSMSIRYGRIGTNGQSSSKDFPTPEKARAEAEKQIGKKIKKGYERAVMGVRQKRSITRRSVESKQSKSKQSPVLWQFNSGASAFGVFVDEAGAWVGNQDGRVFQLDLNGKVQRQFKLPDGVKCIVADEDFLYAGCDDGKVYDLNGKVPSVAYEIKDDVDIYWIDICDGVLGVSDAHGTVAVMNHEDESQWEAKSSGGAGWMVRCDEIGVYHGHAKGVTMYDWEDGGKIWHKDTGAGVLFGWQEDSCVFAGTMGRKIEKFSKQGEKGTVYDCDSSVYSCASTEDGKFVFGGDQNSSLYCFAEGGERLWKLATGCGSALSMQYHADRLYIVTTEGMLTCIDASEAAIADAKKGKVPKAKSIKAPKASEAAEVTTELETTTDHSDGVVVECYTKGSGLKVRAISSGYKKSWNVQFPKNLRAAGAKYVVAELRESARGGFYRAYGEIKRLEE